MTDEELRNRIAQFRRTCKQLRYATMECLNKPSDTATAIQEEICCQRNAQAVAICEQLMVDHYEEEQRNEMANQQPTKTEGAE